MLFWHWVRRPASRAAFTAGSKSPTSTPMMLMTTRSSMSVKPWGRRVRRAVIGVPFIREGRDFEILTAGRSARQAFDPAAPVAAGGVVVDAGLSGPAGPAVVAQDGG